MSKVIHQDFHRRFAVYFFQHNFFTKKQHIFLVNILQITDNFFCCRLIERMSEQRVNYRIQQRCVFLLSATVQLLMYQIQERIQIVLLLNQFLSFVSKLSSVRDSLSFSCFCKPTLQLTTVLYSSVLFLARTVFSRLRLFLVAPLGHMPYPFCFPCYHTIFPFQISHMFHPITHTLSFLILSLFLSLTFDFPFRVSTFLSVYKVDVFCLCCLSSYS